MNAIAKATTAALQSNRLHLMDCCLSRRNYSSLKLAGSRLPANFVVALTLSRNRTSSSQICKLMHRNARGQIQRVGGRQRCRATRAQPGFDSSWLHHAVNIGGGDGQHRCTATSHRAGHAALPATRPAGPRAERSEGALEMVHVGKTAVHRHEPFRACRQARDRQVVRGDRQVVAAFRR